MARTGYERCLLLLGAALVALFSARWGAGSWHDASRLATVECLVDYHTFAIDQSVYVELPTTPSVPWPYARDAATVGGTLDRVLINGRFYSHQPPAPALLMAVEYQLWRWCNGPPVRARPDLFYFFMTLGSSGIAYVLAVGCTHAMGVRLGLASGLRLALPISLALSTMALVYVRNVNNHLMLLGVTSALVLTVVYLGSKSVNTDPSRKSVAGAGLLAGLAYAIDPAVGFPLLICTAVLLAYRFRPVRSLGWFSIGALPWILLHQGINYAIGGTLKPYGSVPAYLVWPGSAFDVQSMTGVYSHASVWQLVVYAMGLLVGNRGFLIHNPPMLLAVLGAVVLLRRRPSELPEVGWAVGSSAGTWLIYALFSNNYSGQCLSVRWFIPLLALGFLVLGVFLKHYPRYAWAFVLISVWGSFFAIESWFRGPWQVGHAHG
jgi:hypothetical protein